MCMTSRLNRKSAKYVSLKPTRLNMLARENIKPKFRSWLVRRLARACRTLQLRVELIKREMLEKGWGCHLLLDLFGRLAPEASSWPRLHRSPGSRRTWRVGLPLYAIPVALSAPVHDLIIGD